MRHAHPVVRASIVAGFLLGAAVLVFGLLLLWIADELIGVTQVADPEVDYSDFVGLSLTFAIEVTAVVGLVAYVARNRRR